MTSPQSSEGREIARRLLAREATAAAEPVEVAAALQQACARVAENLQSVVGRDGYDALLTRVLAATQREHPVLMEIRRVGGAGISLDGVVASVESYGVTAVFAALESMLAALVDVLSGLIGADMVLNILDHDGPAYRTPAEGTSP